MKNQTKKTNVPDSQELPQLGIYSRTVTECALHVFYECGDPREFGLQCAECICANPDNYQAECMERLRRVLGLADRGDFEGVKQGVRGIAAMFGEKL
jgi:hypothetical protein